MQAFGASTSRDDVYQVFGFCFCQMPRRVHDFFMIRDMHDGPMPIDYSVWIVRNEFRTILVDTGISPAASRDRQRPLTFDPVDGLRRIGIEPDEIDDVIVTHLHYDHAGNIGRFGRACFHVQDAEVGFATGRCMCDAHHRAPFDVEDVVALVRQTFAGKVRFHAGDAEPFPGISLHAFPGHSAAVQSVRVNTQRGPVILASDATHFFSNVLNDRPSALTLDSPRTIESYRGLLKLAGGVDRLIPGHDPKVRRLYPSLDVNGLTMLALHEEPSKCDPAELARTDDYGLTEP